MLDLNHQTFSDGSDDNLTLSSLPAIKIGILHKHLSEKIQTASLKSKSSTQIQVVSPTNEANGPPGSEPTRSSSFAQDGTPH